MDEDFVQEMGEVTVRLNKDPKAKIKCEAIATFDTKEVRDSVRCEIAPSRSFTKRLMALAYDIKKKNPDLTQNVKFDEECLGLYMDVQVERDGQWRRIVPDQARKLTVGRPVMTISVASWGTQMRRARTRTSRTKGLVVVMKTLVVT